MTQIEDLYRSHGPALLSYLRRSFGRRGAAEDMLHETFLCALNDQERLAEAVSPRAWLFGIARRVGLNNIRRRPMEPLVEVPAPAVPEDMADLREAIERLPISMRESLELRLRERLSYEEIALVTEVPVGTVRSRLHSAMCRLREVMDHGSTHT